MTDTAPLPDSSGSALYCKEHGKCIDICNSLYGVPTVSFPFAGAIPAKITKKFLGKKDADSN